MARWGLILLGVGAGAGGLALALTSGGGSGSSPVVDPTVAALSIRVRNRKRLNGTLDPRLTAFLDWWDAHGPFMVTVGVDGGLRTDEARQEQLFAEQKTHARTLAATPHGRRGAVDLWPYKPESVAAGTFVPDFDVDNPETLARYRAMGEAGKRMGLVWGGDFKSLKDLPHFEVPDWRTLPFPPPLLEVT